MSGSKAYTVSVLSADAPKVMESRYKAKQKMAAREQFICDVMTHWNGSDGTYRERRAKAEAIADRAGH